MTKYLRYQSYGATQVSLSVTVHFSK